MRMSPTEERFEGKVDVDVEVREATDVLWLHAGDNLEVRSAKLSGFASAVPRIERPTAAPGGDAASVEDLVALAFDAPLRPGLYKINLAYDGKLPARDGRGAYRQEDRGDFYVFTQFESTSARRAFPCFDEPGFKTPWTISLQVPKDQLAFANTPQTAEKIEPDGWKTVSFAPSKPLPSYLVAFAVGPFEVVDGGKAGENRTPIRIIVPKGKSAEAQYAAQTTGQVLERLEKYFGMPYPYEKLDHIAVPQKGGAMENPGLITYGTGTILGKPEDRSIKLQRGYLAIAAHELGHIWFGDLVTTAWWDDIWLNEAFATWIAAKIVDQWHPEWDGAVNRVGSKNGVMGSDALVAARRIRQPIASRHDIANAFDGITYQKGGAVITMFESFVGEEPFRKAVHDYLVKHAHGNATATDFLNDVGGSLQKDSTVEKSRAEAFASAFATFLDQPGIPFVAAELSCDKGAPPKLLLSQQRYLPKGSPGTADQTWKVPVCASYPGGKSCTLMTGPSAELPLAELKACPAWVNPNANAAGYYRVHYKGDLLSRLLKGKALPIHERIAILGDALALVRSGHMQEGEVLALVPDLVAEGDRHLVAMTLGLVSGLSDHLVADDLRPNYRRLVNKLYTARARQLGWKPKPGEDDGTRLLRPALLALVAREDDAALAAEARKLAEAWLADRSAIDHDLVGTVMHAAGRNADRALWDRLHDAAKKAHDRKERAQALGAMGAVRDAKLVEENLKIVLSDELDPRESLSLLWGAAGDPKTRQLAYDFVKANYDRILARLPKDSGASLAGIAGGFCDAEHRADAEAFFKERTPKLNGGPRVLAQTLESMALCDAGRAARQASVTTFLKKY
jgi:alanyl aminopeptidase